MTDVVLFSSGFDWFDFVLCGLLISAVFSILECSIVLRKRQRFSEFVLRKVAKQTAWQLDSLTVLLKLRHESRQVSSCKKSNWRGTLARSENVLGSHSSSGTLDYFFSIYRIWELFQSISYSVFSVYRVSLQCIRFRKKCKLLFWVFRSYYLFRIHCLTLLFPAYSTYQTRKKQSVPLFYNF